LLSVFVAAGERGAPRLSVPRGEALVPTETRRFARVLSPRTVMRVSARVLALLCLSTAAAAAPAGGGLLGSTVGPREHRQREKLERTCLPDETEQFEPQRVSHVQHTSRRCASYRERKILDFSKRTKFFCSRGAPKHAPTTLLLSKRPFVEELGKAELRTPRAFARAKARHTLNTRSPTASCLRLLHLPRRVKVTQM